VKTPSFYASPHGKSWCYTRIQPEKHLPDHCTIFSSTNQFCGNVGKEFDRADAVTPEHVHTTAWCHYTHPFNGPLSGTTRVSRYEKGKTNLDFTEARDSEWQWHPLGHMQVCTLLQSDNHARTPPLSFFTGRMPFLPPNQQCQSAEGMVPLEAMINFTATMHE